MKHAIFSFIFVLSILGTSPIVFGMEEGALILGFVKYENKFESLAWPRKKNFPSDPTQAQIVLPGVIQTEHGERYNLDSDQKEILKKIITEDRKSTRLNSSHTVISYAVFCLKK